ncbi:uncharacterized SAM-binding protein YcdF (DUF218 family) [Paenibacillus phyllosphaerae]|uniref:Uncharacterized SAM-binding protein YcdF (DUF218 family) n=1 Tax=Paenibacillus phyllosphaerae TaxID=274593 RepID=A0A7W5AX23_9BACL|nr:YdcF family protein [Paenibacillus phyllosphaerae]MBB3110375.1 uncharacterized SAM-binding protein YcdF (DUF218 family) [Paenibacillus phyllosphaerae]
MKTAAAKPRSKPHKRKRRRSFMRLLLRLIAVGLALLVFWCGYSLWYINSYVAPKSLSKADAAIVLGAALWQDKPSPGLKERLDHTLTLYKNGDAGHFIVSGGLDQNGSTITEAEGMRDYLVQHGVPIDRIVLEQEATSTYENLLYSKPLAEKKGWTNLIIVTHEYHAPRAADIADYLGYSNTVVSGTKSVALSAVWNQTREVLAFTKWKLDELMLSLGLK